MNNNDKTENNACDSNRFQSTTTIRISFDVAQFHPSQMFNIKKRKK